MAEALIYDGVSTLSVTKEQAEALQYFCLIEYSPEDGPMGIMYRPTGGRTVAEIEQSLVIDAKAIGVTDHSDSS